jgi:hypothetical protein
LSVGKFLSSLTLFWMKIILASKESNKTTITIYYIIFWKLNLFPGYVSSISQDFDCNVGQFAEIVVVRKRKMVKVTKKYFYSSKHLFLGNKRNVSFHWGKGSWKYPLIPAELDKEKYSLYFDEKRRGKLHFFFLLATALRPKYYYIVLL